MRHVLNYDRIDLVYDRQFEKSLKEGKRSDRKEGSQYLFKVDSTVIDESFLKNNRNKNKLNKYLSLKLLEIHQGDQIMFERYRNTSLNSTSSCSELDAGFGLSMRS